MILPESKTENAIKKSDKVSNCSAHQSIPLLFRGFKTLM